MFDDAAAVPGSSKDAAAEKEEGDSYEELVMKRVAAYVQQSQVNTAFIIITHIFRPFMNSEMQSHYAT